MADNDVQLDLKKRARRRLVGAIALALVAAIVLPMVMDSEPKPGSDELQIRIPSQEGSNFASRLINGAAPPPASPVLPAQSAPQTAPKAAASAPTSPSSAPVAVQSRPLVPEQSVPAPNRAASSSSHAASSSRAASSRSASKSSAAKPVSEAQRALEILDGKPAPKEAADQKYYVQLGAFRDEANAREVIERARAAGVKASGQRSEDKTRLRAGPFPDRGAAEAVVSKLRKAGMNGIVTSK